MKDDALMIADDIVINVGNSTIIKINNNTKTTELIAYLTISGTIAGLMPTNFSKKLAISISNCKNHGVLAGGVSSSGVSTISDIT